MSSVAGTGANTDLTARLGDTDAAYRPLEDGLRMTGRYLDRRPGRLHSLCVVPDGVVVTRSGVGHDADVDADTKGATTSFGALRLPHDELAREAWAAREARGEGERHDAVRDTLFPTGYEDFLRALGSVAALRDWAWLRVIVLDDAVVIRCGAAHRRRQIVLERDDIHALLNAAFHDRASSAASDGLHSWPGPFGVPATPSERLAAVPVEQVGIAGRYRNVCDAVASYLTAVRARDVLLHEIGDDVLVAYMAPDASQAATLLTPTDLAHHLRQGARVPQRLWRGRKRLTREMQALGEQLDRCGAVDVIAQELGGGAWGIQYGAMYAGGMGEPRVGRVHTLFDAECVKRNT